MNNTDLKNTSLSHATMRKEDLIPCFYDFLSNYKDIEFNLDILTYHHLVTVGEWFLIKDFIDWDTYYESEDSDFDLEDLFNSLNSIAPEGFYFGSHPGDGSDYGFWEGEDYELDENNNRIEV